jgi:hypothetical protein
VDVSEPRQEMRTTMARHTQKPRFTDGQRVRVILLREADGTRDQFRARLLNYYGMIGYVTDSEHMRSETEFCRYEVLISKIGVRISLPEECLESAESGRPDL